MMHLENEPSPVTEKGERLKRVNVPWRALPRPLRLAVMGNEEHLSPSSKMALLWIIKKRRHRGKVYPRSEGRKIWSEFLSTIRKREKSPEYIFAKGSRGI